MISEEKEKEIKGEALKCALAFQRRPGMIQLPDGNWYNYGSDIEEYLTQQCAMLADQNIAIETQTLYDLQPDSDIRYTLSDIERWFHRHPHYAMGRY